MEFFRGPAAPGVDEEFIAIIESTSMTMYKETDVALSES